jgi:hypothetical protein
MWFLVWPAAVDAVITAWALVDFYQHPSLNSGDVCPGSHLAAVAMFILAFHAFVLLLVLFGGICCCPHRVAGTYLGTSMVAAWVLSVWAVLESVHFACAYSGFLWAVVAGHAALCGAATLTVLGANCFLMTKKLSTHGSRAKGNSSTTPLLSHDEC